MIKLIDLLFEIKTSMPLFNDIQKELDHRGYRGGRKISRGEHLRYIIPESDKPDEVIKNIMESLGVKEKNYSLNKIDRKDYSAGSKSSIYETYKIKINSDIGDYKTGQEVYIVVSKAENLRGAKGEQSGLESFLADLDKFGGSVDIELEDGKVYKNIIGGRRDYTNKKADYVLFSDSGDEIFVSHKGGTKYQQYSGINYFIKNSNQEVENFVKDVKAVIKSKKELDEKKEYDYIINPRDSYYRNIKSNELKEQSVFGVGESFGLNKVQILVIGNLGIKKSGSVYKLIGTHGIYEYGNVPTGEYNPIMAVSYRYGHNQAGIENARFGIYPEKLFNHSKEI